MLVDYNKAVVETWYSTVGRRNKNLKTWH